MKGAIDMSSTFSGILTWLQGNLATVLISGALLAVVVLIIVFQIRKKKKGGGCSCGCADCPMHKNGQCGHG